MLNISYLHRLSEGPCWKQEATMTSPFNPPTRLLEARGEEGFSLLEVVVACAVIGLSLAIAIPNFHYQRVKYGTLAALREIKGAHEWARLEALKRHSQVGIIYASGSRTITVFEDRDRSDDAAPGNTNGALDAGEEVLRRFKLDHLLRWYRSGSGNAIDIGGSVLLYRSDGSLRAPSVAVPALYVADKKDNCFRLRINIITGAAELEKLDSAGVWCRKARSWQWKS
jgi:prepilin-type N-terminal cleavage/methylation domain-containing protein